MTFSHQQIQSLLMESAALKQEMARILPPVIADAAQLVIDTLQSGHKLLICGNGGSAADAQHMAAEFVGRFTRERKGLPAIALTTDTSILTSVSNDYGFKKVFSRQIEALGESGDLFVGITTSGSSENVAAGFHQAKKHGLKTLLLIGARQSTMAGEADVVLAVPSEITARVQEGHSIMIHILCDLVEGDIAG